MTTFKNCTKIDAVFSCSLKIILGYISLFLGNMGCCSSFCHKLEERINAHFHESEIIAKEIFWANLQYQRSGGSFQLRGNGALVLTANVLWFTYLCPNRQIEMQLRHIRAVEAGVLRRQGSSPALIVDFVDAVSGIEDQVVFALRDPQRWKTIIEETIHKSTKLFSYTAI